MFFVLLRLTVNPDPRIASTLHDNGKKVQDINVPSNFELPSLFQQNQTLPKMASAESLVLYHLTVPLLSKVKLYSYECNSFIKIFDEE